MVTSGAESSSQRYLPYGGQRGTAEVGTDFRYTGQRWNQAFGLYDYNARWYDPELRRFVQADSLVPEPANPQSLNRYAYALNNPIKYCDPTGHDAGGVGGSVDWEAEWQWKNRWYNAHGYGWNGAHWGKKIYPRFADVGIADEVLAAAGIQLPSEWVWGFDRKSHVAAAAALYGRTLQGGMSAFADLLGGGARIILGRTCLGSACAPPVAMLGLPYGVRLPGDAGWWLRTGSEIAGDVVHELAHVIDWVNGFSWRWNAHPGLTTYARGNPPQPYPLSWDKWAEAVAVLVMGDLDRGSGTFSTTYKPEEVARYSGGPDKTYAQMDRLWELLNGWY